MREIVLEPYCRLVDKSRLKRPYYIYTLVLTHVYIHTHLSFSMFAGSICIAFSTIHVQHSKTKNTKTTKTQKSQMISASIGYSISKQTCIMQQAGSRQSISSEAQPSTGKHSEAQRNTEKQCEAEHSKAHSIT